MNTFKRMRSQGLLALLVVLTSILFANPSPFQPAAQPSLVSWNPGVRCTPALTTLEQILGSQKNSLGGATKEGSVYDPAIPNKRALNPPCSLTNSKGQGISTFVQVNRVLFTSPNPDEADCSDRYAAINGGAPYPDRNGNGSPDRHCDTYRNLYTDGQPKTCTTTDKSGCMHRIHFEIDRDWKAALYCGPGTACDNRTMFTQITSSTVIDIQGFVYWDTAHVNEVGHNYSGWEIHPLTGWRISSTSSPLVSDFSYDPPAPAAGETVTFTATVSGGVPPFTFGWSFGDGSIGSGNPASHGYSAAGSYTVKLTVTDANSASTQVSKVISVTSGTADVTKRFSPSDDAYVALDSPNANFGLASTLQLDNSPVKHFLLKFAVSGIGTATVVSAKLRIHTANIPYADSSVGGDFYTTVSSGWGETTVTWNNAPAPQTKVASLGRVSLNTWYEVDLTSTVRSDGVVSLRVVSPSTDGADYISAEGVSGFSPELIVTVRMG